jgi:transposase-like protein
MMPQPDQVGRFATEPKYVPLLEKQFRARKRPVGSSWRLDETYVKAHASPHFRLRSARNKRIEVAAPTF